MSPSQPLPADLGGGGGAPAVQRCAGMHDVCVPHLGRRLQQQRASGLKAPSRPRASKKTLSMLEEARGIGSPGRTNKKPLQETEQTANVLNWFTRWFGRGVEKERETQFLEHMIQVSEYSLSLCMPPEVHQVSRLKCSRYIFFRPVWESRRN